MMKKYALIILSLCIHICMAGQNESLEKIKDFYYSIDKNQLIDSLLEYNIKKWKKYRTSWNRFNDSIVDERVKESANIRNDNPIIILTPKLKDLEDYTFKKNIYDFIYIDSTDIEIRHYDIKNNIKTVLNKEKLLDKYEYEKGKDEKYFKRTARLIEKEDYAIWLSDQGIFYKFPEKNLIFLKNDNIYVFRPKDNHIYELNHYVHTFFNEKEFKERAELFNQGLKLCGNNE